MSDNKLLAENTIRRFMKLANVETLTDNFILENQKEELEEEVEETELEEGAEEVEGLEEQEEPVEDEELEMDMELDADAAEPEDLGPAAEEPEMGAADISLTEEEAQLLISLGERLSGAMGAGEEPGDELPPEPEAEEMPDLEDEDPELDDEDPGLGAYDKMQETQEELVNEVLKRVTKRLVAAKLKNRK